MMNGTNGPWKRKQFRGPVDEHIANNSRNESEVKLSIKPHVYLKQSLYKYLIAYHKVKQHLTLCYNPQVLRIWYKVYE